ncbi:hypothetical protein AB0E69_32150 [Kribbella sp. NPDC026611]|uniref:hypothetical protein n=1 Tax=Kribbella sp. NPDC026611 TaxID=3154911 RepID=UPI00340C7B96
MEHTDVATTGSTTGSTAGSTAGATADERRARTEWLVDELGRLAGASDNPQEQARYRRTADSLVRLAIALRP